MGKEIEGLAQFAAGTEWDRVPADVQRHTKLVVLDTLAGSEGTAAAAGGGGRNRRHGFRAGLGGLRRAHGGAVERHRRPLGRAV